MTNEAKALAHRERLRQAIDNMEKTDVCLDVFDRALAEARREGLEEAAKLVERDIGRDDDIWFLGTVRRKRPNDLLKERAELLRDKAQEVKP